MAREVITTEKSLSKLCIHVLDCFPESQSELYLAERGGKMQSEHGRTEEMLDCFREYCTQFPCGLLRLRTDHPYGIIIMLWCHCTPETVCEKRCARDADRPKAVLCISVPEIGNRLGPHSQAAISTQALQEMTLLPPASGTDRAEYVEIGM